MVEDISDRRVRIDSATEQTTTLVGATPTITNVQVSSPGSVSAIQGRGLTNATVRIGEMPGLVLGSSDTSLIFQMPWRVPLTETSLTIPEGGVPYFADAMPIDLYDGRRSGESAGADGPSSSEQSVIEGDDSVQRDGSEWRGGAGGFFGLAPGTIGVWQMDVLVPSNRKDSSLFLTINFNFPPPNSDVWEATGAGPIPVGR